MNGILRTVTGEELLARHGIPKGTGVTLRAVVREPRDLGREIMLHVPYGDGKTLVFYLPVEVVQALADE